MKKYFTSDLHIGDKRLNQYQRNLHANSTEEFDDMIINNWNNMVNDEDIIYLLGDIVHDISKVDMLSRLKGHINR